MKSLIIFFLTALVTINSFSQSFLYYESDIIPEIGVELPGEVYLKEARTPETNIPLFEFSDEAESYSFAVMLFDESTGSYEFYANLGIYNKEFAEDMDYIGSTEYSKGELNNGSKFNVFKGYSKEDEAVVFFGVIHDIKRKKLYELELLCYSISTDIAEKIIGSISYEY